MCGIAGVMDLRREGRVREAEVEAMAATLYHRGPDARGLFLEPDVGFGFRRLRIIDLLTGDQPIFNEDRSLVLICNGEIFNYVELRRELEGRGHVFTSRTDVEVLVHLYEELGTDCVDKLNGQFAFAIYDCRKHHVFMARDHFGVNPLYYCVTDGLLLFGSEAKAILEHPAAPREVDLVGLDQVLSLPGLVSPRTIFRGVESLKSGHALLATQDGVRTWEYWDLDYPEGEETLTASEDEVASELLELLERSVAWRLQADVPVGFYVSGGLDSSLVTALGVRQSNGSRDSFSISFTDQEIDERPYQQLLVRRLGCRHHEIRVDPVAILERLEEMVFHCESPVKETFNTCALALSQATRREGITVVLAGEGADELFGGYPGYRFDAHGKRRSAPVDEIEAALEEELREELWGDSRIFYEKNQIPFREIKKSLYSREVNDRFEEDVDCLAHPLVNKKRLKNRPALHQRSYLDFKLRLADHLLSEHGDRMVMAHSVEARYPFLDVDLVDFARRIPPSLKVRDLTEKYIVKKIAREWVPAQIVDREKFGFRAPGSPVLLQRKTPWVQDLLSYETIRRHKIFDPDVVETLKKTYSQDGFRLHPHLDTDLLMVVLTFNLLCEKFDLKSAV